MRVNIIYVKHVRNGVTCIYDTNVIDKSLDSNECIALSKPVEVEFDIISDTDSSEAAALEIAKDKLLADLSVINKMLEKVNAS